MLTIATGNDARLVTVNDDGSIELYGDFTVGDAAKALRYSLRYLNMHAQSGAVLVQIDLVEPHPPHYLSGYSPTPETDRFWRLVSGIEGQDEKGVAR